MDLMNILDRYLLTKFFKVLFFSLLSFITIYVIVDLIEHIDFFIDRKAVLGTVILYYIFFIPYIVVLTLPVAMLLATLFSLGSLARNNELLAIKSSGKSLYRILLPLYVASFFISIAVLLTGEYLIPFTNQKKDLIKKTKIERITRPETAVRFEVYTQGENGYIFRMRQYDATKKEAEFVLIQKFEDNKLREQVTADKMFWQNQGWVLENVRERVFAENPEADTIENYQSYPRLFRLDLKARPELFAKRPKSPSQMDFFELKKYINLKKKSGSEVVREQVDLYFKISFPLVNFIIVLFGAPLASNPKRSGLATSFGITVIISFIYYTLLKMGQSLGYSQKLPAPVSAWITNILFAALGVVFLIKARK